MKHSYIILMALLYSVASVTAGVSCLPAFTASSQGDRLPEIISFTVSPSIMGAGDSAILAWQSANALSVSIDHDIGAVATSGQINVAPTSSTIYKITASNVAGIRNGYVTLFIDISGAKAGNIIGSDPVTGRNAQVDFSWRDYYLSRQYQVQIARDPAFTLRVYDPGAVDTSDAASPAFWMPPGTLEAGHTYYWRVRGMQSASGGLVDSPWSETRTFTVEPGYNGIDNSYVLQAFTPADGSTRYPVKPLSFNWSGYQGITRYQFILAKDAQLHDIVVDDFASTTTYAVKDPLEYDTAYYWQVRAVEPALSDASAIFTFHTVQAPQSVQDARSILPDSVPQWAMIVILGGLLLLAVLSIFLYR
ncbi:MAG: hypothetical protein ACYDHZ_10450, partial [Dehalococcoidia bacterium]